MYRVRRLVKRGGHKLGPSSLLFPVLFPVPVYCLPLPDSSDEMLRRLTSRTASTPLSPSPLSTPTTESLEEQLSFPPPPIQPTSAAPQLQEQYFPPPPSAVQPAFPGPQNQDIFIPPPPQQWDNPGISTEAQLELPSPPAQQQFYSFPPPPFSPPPFSPPPTEEKRFPTQQDLSSPESSAEAGTFNGGTYTISHRSANTALTVQLSINCPLVAKPGAMIAMSPTVTLTGALKFSVKKWVAGASLAVSHYTGPGEVIFAPPMPGDISVLRIDSGSTWRVGKHNFLAATAGIVKDVKAQGLSKAFFSGEGLYTYALTGDGLGWIASYGAIIRKDLATGEKYLVDNNHLVAWNAKYNIERITSGGIISELSAAEGWTCSFTGPGTVYLQTRSPKALSAWLVAHGAS